MGRHSNVRKTGAVKYILLGIIFLVIAGSSYLVVTTLFAQQQEMTKPVARNNSSIKKEDEIKTEEHEIDTTVIESSSTDLSTTSTSEQSDTNRLELDAKPIAMNAGQVYYGVHYFDDGKDFSSDNSAPTVSASIIKVFIMEYAYTQADLNVMMEGKTLNDWIVPMIQQSDNDATNQLIDYFGMENLNEFFLAQGYQDTHLERKMLDSAARAQGKENYTSLNDCMTFLKKLYQHKEVYPQSAMLEIMKGQAIRTKIPSKLPNGIIIANKTGELENVENDIGLVFSETNPFAIVILSQNVTNTDGIRNAIGDFALAATQVK